MDEKTARIVSLIRKARNAKNNPLTQHETLLLYSGIAEAVINCLHHGTPPVVCHDFWTGADDGFRTLSVIDGGVSLPETMFKKGVWEKWANRLPRLFRFDGHLIKRAVLASFLESGKRRTRTRQKNRGRGLSDFFYVLKALSGEVRIWSRHGFCAFALDTAGAPLVRECRYEKYKTTGTRVEWRFNFDGAQLVA